MRPEHVTPCRGRKTERDHVRDDAAVARGHERGKRMRQYGGTEHIRTIFAKSRRPVHGNGLYDRASGLTIMGEPTL
ncbi:hypothetical protein GCM10022253_13730 [Sphingomonas endophytica]